MQLAATLHRNPKPQHPQIQQSAMDSSFDTVTYYWHLQHSSNYTPVINVQRLEQVGSSHKCDGQHMVCTSIHLAPDML